jgi:hypothetical protein
LPDTEALPSVAAPLRKMTVPVADPPLAGAITALRVTLCPKIAGLELALSKVEVAA